MGNKVKWDRILIVVVLISLASFLLFSYPIYYPLPQITATTSSFILNNIGIDSAYDNTYVVASFKDYDRIFELSRECSGIILFSMFLLGIFIVPGFNVKHRLLALLFIPLLFIGNVLRIVLGIVIGYKYSINAAVLFHNSVGQVLMFLIIITCYVIWLKLTKNFPSET